MLVGYFTKWEIIRLKQVNEEMVMDAFLDEWILALMGSRTAAVELLYLIDEEIVQKATQARREQQSTIIKAMTRWWRQTVHKKLRWKPLWIPTPKEGQKITRLPASIH